jgi:hypothetical protein
MLVDNYDDANYADIAFTDADNISESGGFLSYGTSSGADVSHTHSNLNIMSSAYRRVILRMKTTHPGSDLATKALDGDASTIWHSGASAPGWIRVDLGADRTIARVKLLTSMSTSGPTSHTVRLLNSSLTPIASSTLTNENTADNTWLKWVIAKSGVSGVSGVRYMDVKTTSSPCQVAWREIQVCGENCGTNYALGKTAIASTTRSTWTGTGKLYWDFGTGIDADRSLSFTVYPDGQWRTYNLDVGNNANWKGTIKALRIDAHDSPASQSGATFAFDYLTVTD